MKQMINSEKNELINYQLSKLYKENSEALFEIWKKHFSQHMSSHINFGIIDIKSYDTDNGILFIAKETRGCGFSLIDWIRGFVVNDKKIDTNRPQIWYNLGRWAKLIQNSNADIEDLASEKEAALSGLRAVAFTNINKIGGFSSSGAEFWSLAASDVVREVLKEEIRTINPQIILLCGKGLKAVIEGSLKNTKTSDDKDSIWNGANVIEMPHPSTRTISKKQMLYLLKKKLKDVSNCEKTY